MGGGSTSASFGLCKCAREHALTTFSPNWLHSIQWNHWRRDDKRLSNEQPVHCSALFRRNCKHPVASAARRDLRPRWVARAFKSSHTVMQLPRKMSIRLRSWIWLVATDAQSEPAGAC